jgi:flagellar biosynthesis protein FlhB
MPKQDGATEKATPRRKQESRKKGQVLKSKEANNFFTFLAFFVGVIFFGEMLIKQIVGILVLGFDMYALGATTYEILTALGKKVLPIILIGFLICMVFALVNYMLQVGFLFSPEIIKPDFKKVNPVNYWKNIFNLRKTGMDLVQNFIALVVICAVVYNVYLNNSHVFSQAIFLPWMDTLLLFEGVFRELLFKLLIAFLVLGGVDYFYQRFEYEESIKMKKQDVKDEMKNNQGDPHIKQRQRQTMIRMLRQEVASKVPDGSMVVMNPTHYAVCIRYKKSKGDEVPRVIAKGVDSVAMYMKEIAEREGVPVIQNAPLARDLYARRDAGEYIPEDLYRVISLIIVDLLKENEIDID